MMKVVRFYGQRDIRLEEVPIPKCGKDQVKVLRFVSMGLRFAKVAHRSNQLS